MTASPSEIANDLGRIAEGDRVAFTRLYKATSVKLFGIVLRILKDRALGEEVLQEVYVKIWNRAGDFQPDRASPITWLATIARNRALDEIRRRMPDTDSDPDLLERIADPGATPVERLEANADIVRLNDCLDKLEPPRRDMVRLAYLDGHSRQELADRFGQPLNTVKTWLHRSLKQLKECLGT